MGAVFMALPELWQNRHRFERRIGDYQSNMQTLPAGNGQKAEKQKTGYHRIIPAKGYNTYEVCLWEITVRHIPLKQYRLVNALIQATQFYNSIPDKEVMVGASFLSKSISRSYLLTTGR